MNYPQLRIPEGAQLRFLDVPPLDIRPVNMPKEMERIQSECRLNREPCRIEVKILSIDGVPQRHTYMRLRTETVAKIEEEIRRARECPIDPSDE